MGRIYFTVLVLLLSLWGGFALAQESIVPPEVRAFVINGQESKEDARKAYTRLQELLEQRPDHPLLLAYFGSSETLIGKYAWMPWNKLSYVNDGIAHLDRALRLAEQTPQSGGPLPPLTQEQIHDVWVTAANTFVALPERFNTFERGKRLLRKLLAAEAGSNWSDLMRKEIYKGAARVAEMEQDPEERKWWQSYNSDSSAQHDNNGK